jgi:hypothetical protein
MIYVISLPTIIDYLGGMTPKNPIINEGFFTNKELEQ